MERWALPAYTPVMTDYPDWQTFPNAQSDNLFTAYNQTLTPGTHLGPVLPALSWSSIMIAVSASAGAGQVMLNHFADQAATQQIDSDTWPFNANTRLRVRSPLRGKFVRLDVTVTSAGNLTGEFWSNFLSASSERISFPVSQQNLSDFNHSLAANGTATYTSGEISAGLATFYFNPRDTTGKLKCTLHAVDELGNSGQLIAAFGQPTTLTQQLIAVPDLILQVEIDNTDTTTAHSYDFSLTIPPQ